MLICQESVLKFMKWMDAEIPPDSGVSGAETNRAVSVFMFALLSLEVLCH